MAFACPSFPRCEARLWRAVPTWRSAAPARGVVVAGGRGVGFARLRRAMPAGGRRSEVSLPWGVGRGAAPVIPG